VRLYASAPSPVSIAARTPLFGMARPMPLWLQIRYKF
jgi:hypothetical protein